MKSLTDCSQLEINSVNLRLAKLIYWCPFECILNAEMRSLFPLIPYKFSASVHQTFDFKIKLISCFATFILQICGQLFEMVVDALGSGAPMHVDVFFDVAVIPSDLH